jgi:hypothetical protein
VDADVQERAEDQAEREGERREQSRRESGAHRPRMLSPPYDGVPVRGS